MDTPENTMKKVVPLFQNAATAAIRHSRPLAREMGTEFVRTAAQAGAVIAVYAVAIGGAYITITGYQKLRSGVRRLLQAAPEPPQADARVA